jgi:ABC-type transport system involved in cytochrome bd biosynthesis fused ATPase/permease subunit
MATLKAFNRSARALETMESAGLAFRDATMQTLRVAFLSSFALELLASLATALVALVLGIRLVGGHIALGPALAVLIVTPEVYLPLRKAAASFHGSADGVGAASGVLELVGAPEADQRVGAPSAPPRIELLDVRATHDDRDHHTLRSLSAAVAPGGTLALVGPSGIGKSTLLRVLCLLEPLSAGEVLVDGVALSTIERASWQRVAAYVPQDPRLPGRTVAEALRLGRPGIDDARLRVLLDELGLDLALDRPLSGPTATVSAGQRRRLALARALAGDPLVLVLDEPTAHLDAESRQRVEAVVARSRATTIVATHHDFPADVVVALLAPERFRG